MSFIYVSVSMMCDEHNTECAGAANDSAGGEITNKKKHNSWNHLHSTL